VLRRGGGGSLLRKPERAIELYQSVRDAVDCPVTIKLRAGYGSGPESRKKFWKIVTWAGQENIDALTIHPRTVLQRFVGFADWEILKQIKSRFPQITVIGSGDLFDARTAVGFLKTSGVDGLLIARGAIGNPWIFLDLRACLDGKFSPQKPSLTEQGRTILEHFKMVADIYSPEKAVRYFRKFLVRYCKSHPQRKKTQQALLSANDFETLIAEISNWYELN